MFWYPPSVCQNFKAAFEGFFSKLSLFGFSFLNALDLLATQLLTIEMKGKAE